MNEWSLGRRLHAGMRMGAVVAILVAAFWGIWSMFAPVPVIETLRLTSDTLLTLPFSMSRWWDCVFVIPWVMAFVFLFTDHRIDSGAGLNGGLGVGLGVGLVYGLRALFASGFFTARDKANKA